MKRWLLISLGVVIGLPVAAYLVGSLMARNHPATMTIDLAARFASGKPTPGVGFPGDVEMA